MFHTRTEPNCITNTKTTKYGKHAELQISNIVEVITTYRESCKSQSRGKRRPEIVYSFESVRTVSGVTEERMEKEIFF